MALANVGQDDFGGGIYRGRKAPANSVYDCVNGLIDDEGLIYKRGGTTDFNDTTFANDITILVAVYMRAVAAMRIVGNQTFGSNGSFFAFDATSTSDAGSRAFTILGRPASVGDYAIFAAADLDPLLSTPALFYYAGSLENAAYSTGTASFTNGSATVTGSGTSWAANVDAGMIFDTVQSSEEVYAVVKTVDSDTQLTLTAPWAGTTDTGAAYGLSPAVLEANGLTLDSARAFVASAGQRLLWASGNRLYASDRGDPFAFDADRYIELPANANIIGLEGRGDNALIFSDVGMYLAEGLALDAVDAFGNVQWTLQQINKDVILWDDLAIAGWHGGLIIPAIDDLLVMSSDYTLTPVSENIRPLYRDYVKAGHKLGNAAVYRGHYLLPVVDPDDGSGVDALICRLDRGAAWTRWGGDAAAVAFAGLTEESARTPKLLGAQAGDVLDLTGCFDPDASNATDSDSNAPALTITTRDYPTGGSQPGFVNRLRARYILEDDGSSSPTVTPAFSSDEDDDTYTNLTDKGEQAGGTGWAESDGSKYQWATVGKKRERIRFKLTQAGAAGKFVLRSIDLLLRPSGRQ